MAHRVGRGIALLFHDHGTRRGSVVSSTPRPHFTPEKDPVPILDELQYVNIFSANKVAIAYCCIVLVKLYYQNYSSD